MYQCSKSLVTYKKYILTILTLRHIQCLHLMYAEIAWVLVSSGTQVKPQIKIDTDYLSDYPYVSYDYVKIKIMYCTVRCFQLRNIN